MERRPGRHRFEVRSCPSDYRPRRRGRWLSSCDPILRGTVCLLRASSPTAGGTTDQTEFPSGGCGRDPLIRWYHRGNRHDETYIRLLAAAEEGFSKDERAQLFLASISPSSWSGAARRWKATWHAAARRPRPATANWPPAAMARYAAWSQPAGGGEHSSTDKNAHTSPSDVLVLTPTALSLPCCSQTLSIAGPAWEVDPMAATWLP